MRHFGSLGATLRRLLLPVSCLVFTACGSTSPSGGLPDDDERKLIGLLEKFDRMDYNGDGKLTRTEMLQGIEESDVEGIDAAEVDRAISRLDTNGDGKIPLAEANAADIREAGHQH